MVCSLYQPLVMVLPAGSTRWLVDSAGSSASLAATDASACPALPAELLLLLQVLQQISGSFKPSMGAVIARSSANVEDLAGMSGGWVGGWVSRSFCRCHSYVGLFF